MRTPPEGKRRVTARHHDTRLPRPVLAAGLAAALAAPWPTAAQDPSPTSALHQAVLDNGLTVVVVEDHVAPLATVLVAVRSGASTQAPGEEGLAHLYEHMVFSTYGGDPSAFAQAVAELQGRFNGSTDYEVVTYWVEVPSPKTARAIELLGGLLTGTRFKREDLTEARRVVLDELARDQSDPERSLDRQVERQLWGAAWHRRDVDGDSASLGRITLAHLQATFERYYVPNNAAVIVTGDVSAPEVLEQVRGRFRRWKPGADPLAADTGARIGPLPGSRGVLVANPYVRDVTITIALLGPGVRDDMAATYAGDGLFAVLAEPSSRFREHLLGSGRFQEVAAGYTWLREAGPILVRGTTTPALAEEAVRVLLSALEQPEYLLDLGDEDLAIARKARELGRALTREVGASLAPALASWWATAGIDDAYDRRLDAQTLTELRRFAERYIIGRPKVIGVLGPPDVIGRVAQWLRGPGSSRP